jgi:parallel beta-helix repeat protein
MLAAMLLGPAAAVGRDIHVRPGDGLQRVVDNASPGDVLRIHGGHYNPTGGLTVDKRLTLVGYNARPRIRGNCGTTYTVRARHNKVVLNHLKVVGANYAEVDYRDGAEGGKAKDLKLEPKCDGVEYGVNVFDAGAMEVVDNIAWGYEDAGVYVGAISNTGGGTLTVDGNDVFNNNRGILIEDSNSAQQDIAVTNNNAHDNNLPGVGGTFSGIFLTNSTGVLVASNQSNDNGTYGFELVNNSDNNVFNSNTANGNTTAAFVADGTSTGSCGANNIPSNFGLPACS